jgi:hypothetical protein
VSYRRQNRQAAGADAHGADAGPEIGQFYAEDRSMPATPKRIQHSGRWGRPVPGFWGRCTRTGLNVSTPTGTPRRRTPFPQMGPPGGRCHAKQHRMRVCLGPANRMFSARPIILVPGCCLSAPSTFLLPHKLHSAPAIFCSPDPETQHQDSCLFYLDDIP